MKRAAKSSSSISGSLSTEPDNGANEDVSMIDPALLQLTAESQSSVSSPQPVHLPGIRRTYQSQLPLVQLPHFSELPNISMRLPDDNFAQDVNTSYATAPGLPSLSSSDFAPISFPVSNPEAIHTDNHSLSYTNPFDVQYEDLYPAPGDITSTEASPTNDGFSSYNNPFDVHYDEPYPITGEDASTEARPSDNHFSYCKNTFGMHYNDEFGMYYDELYSVPGEVSSTQNYTTPSMFTQPHQTGYRYFAPSAVPANAIDLSRSNTRPASHADQYSGRDDALSPIHDLNATPNVPSRGILRHPRQVDSTSPANESEMDPFLSHGHDMQTTPPSSSARRRVRFSEELKIQSFDASSPIRWVAHRVFTVEWVHAMNSPDIAIYIQSDPYLASRPRHTKMIQDPRGFPGAAKFRDWIRKMHNLPNMAAANFPRLQFNALFMIYRSRSGQRIKVDILTGDWSMAARECLYGDVEGEVVFEFGARLLAEGEMRMETHGV